MYNERFILNSTGSYKSLKQKHQQTNDEVKKK